MELQFQATPSRPQPQQLNCYRQFGLPLPEVKRPELRRQTAGKAARPGGLNLKLTGPNSSRASTSAAISFQAFEPKETLVETATEIFLTSPVINSIKQTGVPAGGPEFLCDVLGVVATAIW